MNSINVTGRLTRDPELRTLPNGTSVCDMRLAVDGLGRNNETGYIDVASFGASAEAAARILTQGWLVAVDGRLEYREWESDDVKRSAYSVVGRVEFLAAPRGADENAPDAQAAAPQTEDIPF